MVQRTNGGVFTDQLLTGSLSHWVVVGADFSGAINEFRQPVPGSAAEIIFTNISASAYINIMNPNQANLSFALEEARSSWTEASLTEMIRSLGTDVGVDHLDLSNVTVSRVPYVWASGGGSESFIDLIDTPESYAGSAGYYVRVNPGEDRLVFTPTPVNNAYTFVAVPEQDTLVSSNYGTLTLIPGANVSITTNPSSDSLTFSANVPDSADYHPIPAGTALEIGNRYFVTSAGTITLPPLTSIAAPGRSVIITKPVGITVFVNVGDVLDEIRTDLGTTDSIEYDLTQELAFVVSSEHSWELQIGATA